MSAYMCSERQLTILAAYAVKHCAGDVPYALRTELEDGRFERRPGDYDRTVGNVFSMLVRENLASVNHRYPVRINSPESEAMLADYKPHADGRRETLPALHIIKLCHHYAYQACEHPGWQDSDARKLVDAIEKHAVRCLPGYDAAPWGL
jgi:hypothetical protein